MLFKGTTSRSAEDIARSVDSIGGNLDAFTAKELVCFNTKVLDEHLSLAFDVLADLVLHPLFRDEDIEKEKGVILEEIKMEADSPDYLVHEIFSSNFWKDHPLGKPILGTRETVKRFDRRHARLLLGRLRAVQPDGDGGRQPDARRPGGLVRAAFRGLCRPARRRPPTSLRSTHARIALRNKKALEQVHLCLGVPSYPLPHQERFACYVLNTLLGGGMSSRLFQNIRERQGLAYAVFSELSPYRDTGCLSIYAGTSLRIRAQGGRIDPQGIPRAQGAAGGRRRAAPRQGPPEGFAHARAWNPPPAACPTWRGRRCTSAASSRWTNWWRASKR